MIKARLAQSCAVLALLTALAIASAQAQTAADTAEDPNEEKDQVNDVVVVTARKTGRAERLQDVPIAVSVFSEAQVEAEFIRELEDLSYSAPNVGLDGVGTFNNIANFTIRGLGTNSSIPSIEPTVGVFVDGVYLGVNYGVIMDLFDVQGVEILRGPQGVLFGRNVTGGAVLINTRTPGDTFAARARASVETGLQTVVAAGVEGPLIEGRLFGKLTGYWRDDEGDFTNVATGNNNFGAEETYFLRPSVRWTPTSDVEIVVRGEFGATEGDGGVLQNPNFVEDEFEVNINTEGFVDTEWSQVIAQADWQVGEAGLVTNIFGWRQLDQLNLSDIDASPNFLFDGLTFTDYEQFSNELRYAADIGERIRYTAGVYYFTQDIRYFERRILAGGALDSTLGGQQEQFSWAVFLSGDVSVTDVLTLNLGARFTEETKEADVATFNAAASACDFDGRSCSFDFSDEETWESFIPRLGATWRPNADTSVYGFWTRGFRSGGFNFRNTSPTALPGPTDQEVQDAFEIGVKTERFNNRFRFNTALFFNTLEGLQREVIVPDDTTGVTQVIRNTADAEIYGIEIDAVLQATDRLSFIAALGYVEGEYTDVREDLNGDGVVDAEDEALELPRLANWSASVVGDYVIPLQAGDLTARLGYRYRDESFSTDNNLGVLPSADLLDASLRFETADGRWAASVFGRNLLDDEVWSFEFGLPASIGGVALGGTGRSLKKGRVIGVEVSFTY